MKKRQFICCLAALVCFYFAACENSILKKWWEEPEEDYTIITIAVPAVTAHPQSAFYAIGTTAHAMTVSASVSDSGQLSYQWYSNDADNNTEGEIIPDATEAHYTPPTDQKGVMYYYVVVTNTIPDNGMGGDATATVVSNTAKIAVDVMPVTIIGLSVENKVYDGTTGAVVTGTLVLSGIINGDDLSIVAGTAAFADANAGNNKPIIFSGWSLGGADAGGYTLQMPNSTADITKADPVVNWPSGLVASRGQTFSQVTLPGNGSSTQAGTFAWTNPADSVSNFSTQSHNMSFTPDDTSNYNTLTHGVTIRVVTVKMAQIPEGTFQRGSPTNEPGHNIKEEPQHTVKLSGFYMSELLVTQELYEAVMGANPSAYNKPVAGEAGTPGKLPVENVSWYDALVFCNKLSMLEGLSPAYRINGSTNPANWGTVPTKQNATWDAVEVVSGSNGYRLPTEAQWEYACRAGTMTAFYTGSVFNGSMGWYASNSGDKTHEVGTKLPNAWGLYDMHGNLNEWCWDRYDLYTNGTKTDPVGPPSGNNRILRGGSFGNSVDYLRSAARRGEYPYTRYMPYGFRLALL